MLPTCHRRKFRRYLLRWFPLRRGLLTVDHLRNVRGRFRRLGFDKRIVAPFVRPDSGDFADHFFERREPIFSKWNEGPFDHPIIPWKEQEWQSGNGNPWNSPTKVRSSDSTYDSDPGCSLRSSSRGGRTVWWTATPPWLRRRKLGSDETNLASLSFIFYWFRIFLAVFSFLEKKGDVILKLIFSQEA